MEAAAINKTPNLNLQKPTSDELYSVQVQNTNMDILDATIKTMQNTDATLVKQADLETHINNKNNPHTVTKEQIGLSNVVNQRQIPAIPDAVTDNGVPVFDGNGYKLKDSGFSIGKSIPSDAIFTDTVYTHPISGVISGTYKSVTVNETGHVVSGSNPTTLSEYGIIDAEPLGSTDTALVEAKEYADDTYTQATGYTDTKISDLINGAPSTLDTLKEIADAMEENQTVVVALETAVGSKASDVDLQAHKNNNTIHVTASQTGKWDNAIYPEDIMTPTTNGIGSPDDVTIGVNNGKIFAKQKAANRGVYTGDLNEVPLESNTLTVHRIVSTNPNIPTANSGILETMGIDDGAYAIQKFTSLLNGDIWSRSKTASIWNPWRRVVTSTYLTANLLATTTGNALDATMGKALDDKITTNTTDITTLNQKLTVQDLSSTLTNVEGAHQLKRYGNLFVYSFSITGAGHNITNGKQIATIPSAYAPPANVSSPVGAYNCTLLYNVPIFSANTTGAVTLSGISGADQTNVWMTGQMSWVK